MRLRSLESEASPYYFEKYEVTFDISKGEANYLQRHGAFVDYNVTVGLGDNYKCTKSKSGIKVIFNDPATILFVDDKKFVSKAHKEKFDEEKGLLMCIAKANGISHLELKRMIKNAQRPENKNGDK